MRRRRITALLLVLVTIVPAYAAATSETVPQAATRVRSAIPASEVYRMDHGTYVGLTLAKLRSYDKAVRGVTVKRATKSAYCIQSTLAGPVVHFDGPRGYVRKGRCGVRGAIVPWVAPPVPPPAPGEEAAIAKSRLRAAIPAIEVVRAETSSYVGLTLAKIRYWDAGIVGIRVVWAARTEYCIESTVGATTYHLHGPANAPAPKRCPAAP